MEWVYDDGGRAEAGYKGEAGDCATRAIAIATGLPYQEVYDGLKEEAKKERPRNGRKRSSVRDGTNRNTAKRYLISIGWEWTPTMFIGSGCQVHMKPDELPDLCIVSLSKHYAAVLHGVVYDTHDPTRDETRCVYGYFTSMGGG